MPNRRSILFGSAALMVSLSSASQAVLATSPDHDWAITGLLVDGLDTPRGLHNLKPRLSWQGISRRRNASQTAWRVGVASSQEAALAGHFDLWDSGRVSGGKCFDIVYEGVALNSRRACWWQVTAWDERGVAAVSSLGYWEMGLLAPTDWSAQWLSAETVLQNDDRTMGLNWRIGPSGPDGALQAFRLVFDLPQNADIALMANCSQRAQVWLDGQSVTSISNRGWGAMEPRSATVSVGKGQHVLVIETKSTADEPVQAAALVRAVLADGRVLRLSSDKLESAITPSGEWRTNAKTDSKWVATSPGQGASEMPARPATLLRKSFQVEGKIASARLYMTALGVYEAEVNGTRLDDGLLKPEYTDYRKHCLYCVEDVTKTLQPGENVLGVHVADGWYGSYVFPDSRFSFGPPPLRIFGQLEIRYEDGRVQTVATGDGWSVAESPITEATLYDGEHYDSRREQIGWSRPGFTTDARWSPALPAEPAKGTLTAAIVPAIRRKEQMPAVKIVTLPNGASVIDFGQNFAGWTRVTLKGRREQTIALRYAELLNADGSVDQSNLRSAKATDRYTFAGTDSPEIYEPRFTYHGFRYVQVEGLERTIRPEEIIGISIRTDLRETSELSLGSHIPQQLWINSRWSQRSNFMGIPTDCPQRDERAGWTGDAHVFWDAASFNMDTAAFTARFMQDMRDAQGETGDYRDIAPTPANSYQQPGSAPGWGDAGVALPWTVWRRFGDTAIIDANWESMSRFIESIRLNNPDLIWSNARSADYGDWLALDAVNPGDPTTPKDLVGTAMWKGAVDQMVDMALATGRQADAARYSALSSGLTRAFQHAFVHIDGTLGNGSQTGYILALQFGLLDASARPAAAKNLVNDIRRRGTLLSTGFLGTPYSLDVLADAGETALVYDLLLRTEYPSWGYMIAKGATTTWERWNSDAGDRSMNSFNHYALGAVAGFMFRRIAGISPTAPGFAEFSVKPLLDKRMPFAGATYDSRLGRIATLWRQESSRFTLDLTVPVGAVATVELPISAGQVLREGGRDVKGQFSEKRSDDQVSVKVRTGVYNFTVA